MENQPKQMNIKEVPKQFCENISIGFAEDFFVMTLLSGHNASVYALTTEHAKRLHQYIGHQIAEYEKKFNKKIEAEWTPGPRSPIQVDDLPGHKKE